MSEPYEIKLGIQLDTDGIRTQINDIGNDIKPVNIEVQLDTRNVQNQINNIRQQIQALGNIRIDFGNGGGGHGGRGGNGGQNNRRQVNESTQAYRELMRVLNELNATKLKLNRASGTSPIGSDNVRTLLLQVQQLENQYNNLLNTFNNQGIRFSADQWNEIESAMERTGRRIDDVQSKMADKSAIEKQTQAYKELLTVSKEIDSLEINIAKLKGQGGNDNQIAELEKQLKTLQVTYRQIVTTMDTPLSADQWGNIYTQIAQTQDKLAQLDKKIADTKANLAKGIQLKFADGTFTNDVSRINSEFNKLSEKSQDLRIKINQVEQALKDIGTASAAGDVEALIAANERYERSLKDVENQLKINKRAEQDSINLEKLQQNRTNLSLKMGNWLKDNSAAAKQFGSQIRKLQVELESCDNIRFDGIKREFIEMQRKAQLFGQTGKSLTDRIKAQWSKYSAYFGVAELFMYAEQGLRDMFEQVKLIDSAMTELKKVTDETDASYNSFLSNAADRAKEIGTTIDGLVNSTADFARLGYDFSEAAGLAEVANIYAVVGDEVEGVEGATTSLISTMKAFKNEMNGLSDSDFALNIVDKLNEVSNNFAITSGGLGEALTRSASSMSVAGNTLDETVGLITAANTVVQNPEKVGKKYCRL